MTTGARPGPFDVLVLGSGVAGLSAAVRLAGPGGPSPSLALGVLTKGVLSQSATRWAQGGVAAVLGADEDSTDLHLADTLAAGAGLCDEEAVRILVDEGPGRVHELIALGVEFDREATGLLALAREGGHSRPRVVHAGGAATGAEVERALVDATYRSASAVLEGWFALDLLVEGGRCTGVLALPPGGADGPVEVRADHVVLATGGAGQLFSVTTNPPESTGDGVAMALRAGVPTADVEFVQFHPTALHHPAMPRPLLSEALRGHGALLRDRDGERFVDELAPRDVVSRAMAARMAEQGVDHLWLDATGLERFSARFPTIAASLSSIGLDPQRDWLPIAPAAHHLSGGVVTDLWGATALPGLWAVGEVACTGRARGQPAGLQLAARGHGVRGPPGRAHPVGRGASRRRAARCGPCWATEPIDGIGCTELAAAGHAAAAGPRPVAGHRRDEAARHGAARHDARCRRRAQRRLPGRRARRRGGGRRRPRGPFGLGGGRRAGEPSPAGGRAVGLRAGPHRKPRRPRPQRVPRRRAVVAAPAGARPRRARPSGGPWLTTARYAGAVHDAVERALAEDLGPEGDLTAALVPEDVRAQFALRSRRAGVLAGPRLRHRDLPRSSTPTSTCAGTRRTATSWRPAPRCWSWPAGCGPILTAERTALNFLGRLSGVATLTAQFVTAAHESNPSVAVLDTRKTTPGLRLLEKAAVRAGGGTNHRAGLSDACW